MKNLILFFCVFTLVLTSCKNEDDSQVSDPLIGVWKPYKTFENNVEVALSMCREMDQFTFNEDGSYENDFYQENNGTCNLEETDNGQWSHVSGNTYTLTYLGETTNEDIFFEDNTFYILYTEIDGIDDPVTINYKDVFIRVE